MKKWIGIGLAALLLASGTQMAEASLLGQILGRVKTQSQSGEKAPAQTNTGTRNDKARKAMGALMNLQWVGVAKSSGGNIYFDQDTMNDRLVNGQRRVTATVKNEFSDEGVKEIVKESGGDISKKDNLAYSLFLVDFGEKDCFVASRVSYYNKDGKLLLELPVKNAYSDVTSRSYGKPYAEGSIEKKMQQAVFSYADRVKEEEKEQAAEAAQ